MSNFTEEESNFTEEQLTELYRRIEDKIQDRTELLVHALDLNYDASKLIVGFDGTKPGWDVFNAVCILRVAVLAYRSKKLISLELERCGVTEKGKEWNFFENKQTNTQAFGFTFKNAIVIAFRGTETKKLSNQIEDLKEDLKIKRVPFDPQKHDYPLNSEDSETEFGKVHYGFLEAINSVWGPISKFIKEANPNGDKKLWFTGHSLGAALATLAVAKIKLDPNNWPQQNYEIYGLFTIGQPRTGNDKFAQKINLNDKSRLIRIVKNNDPVTNIPLKTMGYTHVGVLHYIDRKGKYKLIQNKWSRKWDKIAGYIEFFLHMGKFIALRRIGIDVEFPSPVADHDRHNYLKSIKDSRERKLNDLCDCKSGEIYKDCHRMN